MLVGRTRERSALTDVVARLGDGPACLEVVGEPGIGKTTMLAFLADAAAGAGALVLSGRSSEFDGDLPFGILIDALDRHLGEVDDRWSRNIGANVRAELTAIFPSLSMDGPAARPDSSGERFRTYRAVRSLLERLAATRPLVLTLDDVQWADSSSLELIGALVRRLPRARVLVVVAHRPHQTPQRLLRELADAARAGVVQRVALGPLSQTECESLVEKLTHLKDRRRLFVESGGNPFYLEQLARSRSAGSSGRDHQLGVPLAVTASLLSELEGVSECARQLARGAAVAGDPFDLDLAGDIASLDRAAALAALDELTAANLVRREADALSFAFRHPLVRRAVHESAPPGWLIAAHARAGAALTLRHAPAASRAYHAARSAVIGDQQAIELLQEAATTAPTPAAAARWLQAALRLTPSGGEQRIGLLCTLGRALAIAGLLEESLAALVEAVSCWPPTGDPDRRIEIVVTCATLDRLLGRHGKARERLDSAARALDDPRGVGGGVALAIELATVHVFSAEYTLAREAADMAVQRAAAAGSPILRAGAAAVAAFGNFCVGELGTAHERAAEGAALVAQLDNAELAAQPNVLYTLGWSERCLDDYAAALTHFDRGLEIGRASGHSQLHVELMVGRASALIYWGRLADAQLGFEEAIEAARLSENLQTLGWVLAISCLGHMDSGSLERGIEAAREGVALAVDQSTISTACWLALGLMLAEAGKCEDGIAVMEQRAGGPALTGIFPMMRPFYYERMARAEIALGRTERAADWARRAWALVEGVECAFPRAQADRAAAAVLLARGDAVAAADRALLAAATADRVEAHIDAGRSRMLAGRALAAAGRRGEAGEQLRVAEAQFAGCGSGRLREEAVRELRRIGRRVARAGVRGDGTARGLAALSGREREVADLVRARHTNREIAGRLFLSEKTIESHLRSVFVKLGVSSRVDVARALDESS
jgi:DNA-binding NarL/FixJ family response regulator